MILSKNSEHELKTYLKRIKNKKVFILSGKKSFFLSGADKLFNKKDIKNFKFYLKKEKYPKIEELEKIILSIKKINPDIIFAIGGGSVIDYAKIANNLNNLSTLKKNIINSKKKYNKIGKLIAIPTTAGSGAEVTSNAVIYINGIKCSVEGESLTPDNFFLIPRLILKGNRQLKSSTGFDAISQSIESLISKKSNEKSILFAKKSLELSLKNYLNFLKHPNQKNCTFMSISANLSGKAISISKTTAPHAVSYPFTSHFGINHGHAVSLTLNEFLKFNYFNLDRANCDFDLKKRFDLIFQLTNTKSIFELDNFLQQLKSKAKLEGNFRKLKIPRQAIENKILGEINLQRLSNNPINLTIHDIKKILFEKFY